MGIFLQHNLFETRHGFIYIRWTSNKIAFCLKYIITFTILMFIIVYGIFIILSMCQCCTRLIITLNDIVNKRERRSINRFIDLSQAPLLRKYDTWQGSNFSLRIWTQEYSVADPGCLSRILIFTQPDPGSKNSNKREG